MLIKFTLLTASTSYKSFHQCIKNFDICLSCSHKEIYIRIKIFSV